MNKKILFLSIGLFYLSFAHALRLPEISATIGKPFINLWLWELDNSVDDRDDIENNMLATISSVDSNIHINVVWLDAEWENYQHFDNAIDKISDANDQLDGFIDYVSTNYPYTGNNDYHMLMTESAWNWITEGMTYRQSHHAIACDNSEKTAAHEMGHMFGAEHNWSVGWFTASIMFPDNLYFLNKQNKFWSSSNINKVRKTFTDLTNFPRSQPAYANTVHYNNTSHAIKYSGFSWGDKKVIIYKKSIAKNYLYDAEIIDADFDTFLYIYDKDGNLLVFDNNSGDGVLSKLSRQNFGDLGEIYIAVTGNAGEQGNFVLKLTEHFYKQLIIEDNQTLRSLENNADELKKYINSNNEVWLKTRNGAWTGNIILPQGVAEDKVITISVNSSWAVRVTNANEHLELSHGERQSWVYIGGSWLRKALETF